jgi:hypothetical protein
MAVYMLGKPRDNNRNKIKNYLRKIKISNIKDETNFIDEYDVSFLNEDGSISLINVLYSDALKGPPFRYTFINDAAKTMFGEEPRKMDRFESMHNELEDRKKSDYLVIFQDNYQYYDMNVKQVVVMGSNRDIIESAIRSELEYYWPDEILSNANKLFNIYYPNKKIEYVGEKLIISSRRDAYDYRDNFGITEDNGAVYDDLTIENYIFTVSTLLSLSSFNKTGMIFINNPDEVFNKMKGDVWYESYYNNDCATKVNEFIDNIRSVYDDIQLIIYIDQYKCSVNKISDNYKK